MTKKTKPVDGLNKKQILDVLNEDGVQDVMGGLINNSACLSPEQLETAQQLTVLKGSKTTTAFKMRLLQLASYVNSCRLGCQDCFNIECEQRSDERTGHLSNIRARMDPDEREWLDAKLIRYTKEYTRAAQPTEDPGELAYRARIQKYFEPKTIATNPYLLGLTKGSDEDFKPQQILDAFDVQVTRRENLQLQGALFQPSPTLKAARSIVEESKIAITTILEGHNLSPDAEVEDATVREQLVQVVRNHLRKFAY